MATIFDSFTVWLKNQRFKILYPGVEIDYLQTKMQQELDRKRESLPTSTLNAFMPLVIEALKDPILGRRLKALTYVAYLQATRLLFTQVHVMAARDKLYIHAQNAGILVEIGVATEFFAKESPSEEFYAALRDVVNSSSAYEKSGVLLLLRVLIETREKLAYPNLLDTLPLSLLKRAQVFPDLLP